MDFSASLQEKARRGPLTTPAPMDDVALRTQLIERFDAQGGSPTVLSVTSVPPLTSIRLAVPAELDWFRGHFPGRPILAGIVQLHWAVLACRVAYRMSGGPHEIKRLKFKKMLEPPAEIELVLARVDEHQVRFTYSSGGEQNSEGTIVFPGSV